MRKLLLKVWNEEKDDIINRLSLKKEPKIVFGPLKGAMMQTEIMYLYNEFGIVFGSEPKYEIEIDLGLTTFMVLQNLVLTGFKKPKMVLHTTLKFYLCHECRHIWQAETNFFSGKSLTTYTEREYRMRPHEKDANTWACDVFYTNKQTHAIALLNKAMQEHKNVVPSIVRAWNVLK